MAYTGKIFSFDHNWSEAVLERLKWLNTVISHRDASEQRAQIRLTPRRELDYSFLELDPPERAHLEHFIYASQKDNVLIPIWTDLQELAEAVEAGDDEIPVNTVTYDYDVGHYVLLWRDYLTCEAVEIAEVHADHLVLTETLLDDWPVGTVVVPARIGRVAEKVDATTYRPDVRPKRVTCRIAEGAASTNRVAAYAPQQYLLYDMLLVPPETSETAQWSMEASFPLLDFNVGLTARDTGAREKPFTLFSFADKFLERESISDWWAFLNAREGRRVPFWMPSWDRDFVPTQLLFGGFKYLTNGYADLINVAAGRRDIVVYNEQATISYAAETFHPRRLTAVVNNLDGTETATVGMSDFTGGDLGKVRITLMRFCRLEGDEVEMAWSSCQTGQVRVMMRESFHTP